MPASSSRKLSARSQPKLHALSTRSPSPPATYRVAKPLALRLSASLESEKQGILHQDSIVVILDEEKDNEGSGVIRSRVALAKTGDSLGWVTSFKNGKDLLSSRSAVPLASGFFSSAVGYTGARTSKYKQQLGVPDEFDELSRPSVLDLGHLPSPKSWSGQNGVSSRSTSRSTKRRRRATGSLHKGTKAGATRGAAQSNDSNREASDRAAQSDNANHGTSGKAEHLDTVDGAASDLTFIDEDQTPNIPFEFTSSAGLRQIVDDHLREAEEWEGRTYETFESKVWSLIKERGLSVDSIIEKWDRGGDGMINKPEFRIGMRSLGITGSEEMMKTEGIYDMIDTDKSGYLTSDELRAAFKQLKRDAELVNEQYARSTSTATNLRTVADAFRTAMGATITYETEQQALEDMRQEEHNNAASHLGEILRLRNIKIGDLVRVWDDDGGGTIDKKEFRVHVTQLGLVATASEIDKVFDQLDDDGSGELDTTELRRSLKTLQDAAVAQAKKLQVQVKRVGTLQKAAKASQRTAHKVKYHAEARIAEAAAAAEQLAEARIAADAKAKAERLAKKKATAAKLFAANANSASDPSKWKAVQEAVEENGSQALTTPS